MLWPRRQCSSGTKAKTNSTTPKQQTKTLEDFSEFKVEPWTLECRPREFFGVGRFPPSSDGACATRCFVRRRARFVKCVLHRVLGRAIAAQSEADARPRRSARNRMGG